jgi:SAM-dependent methyltransferase
MSADDPIALCVAGRISPEVAIARLVLRGCSCEEIARRLLTPPTPSRCGRGPGGGAAVLARCLPERQDGIARLARMLAESGLDHTASAAAPDDALARIRAAFDRAVACSPEASVAAYSLGDAAILDAATAELMAWLTAEGLVGAEVDVLDLGCGIGRVAAALAPRCRSVLGIDIAPAMIAEAHRRCSAPNLHFAMNHGRDLSAFADTRFDLVLAVDSFPYLMQTGVELAERHVADAARLLRPGGAFVILNVSYRGDLGSDRADVARWAASYGFDITTNGSLPFAIWDGAAFLLHKPAATKWPDRA